MQLHISDATASLASNSEGHREKGPINTGRGGKEGSDNTGKVGEKESDNAANA